VAFFYLPLFIVPQLIFAAVNFIRNNIPNAITCLNLFSGVLAIYFAFNGQLATAAFCVIASGVFDYFDGMVARLLNAKSNIGKDLDSLADMVSFGAAPVFIYINLAQHTGSDWRITGMNPVTGDLLYTYIPFLVIIFSAIRLAIFNNDTRQTDSFIGLNTPSNGLVLSSFALIAHYQPEYFPEILVNPWFMAAYSLLCCFMLVMPLPMFAFKFKHWGFKGNEVRYGFLLLTVVLLAILKYAGIPLVILSYIIISLIIHLSRKPEHEIHS
jgi:CDP-diacylglycerol---serine O-phosphatidyltransferase